MTKDELLDRVRHERSEWEAVLAQIGLGRMLEPGAAGDWTVKDIVAHVAWHEREMIAVLAARALVGSDLWERPLHERNAVIYGQNRDRSLSDVIADEAQAYADLLSAIGALSAEDLLDPGHFPGMPADWQPWQLLANNTYEHYEQHLPSLRTFAEKTPSG